MKLSIVIPVWNEEGNIASLINRIHQSLSYEEIIYELIFIDDHSTDQTRKEIKKFAKHYPVSLFSKQGKKGKAQSLLEGFSYAQYPYICMIDADLQYPPEEIPAMLAKIQAGADVVVANRKTKQ